MILSFFCHFSEFLILLDSALRLPDINKYKDLKKKKQKYCLLSILLLAIFANLNVSGLQAQEYSEYDLKAVYLYNFANFVNWPKETYIIWPGNQPTITFYIGIYGENPFGKTMEIIAKQKKRQNFIWQIDYYTSADEIDTCNILFFTNVKKAELIKVIEHLEGKKILTVGDELESFCELGGMINFLPAGSSKPFEINNEAAKREELIISPKLLKLAKIKNNKRE